MSCLVLHVKENKKACLPAVEVGAGVRCELLSLGSSLDLKKKNLRLPGTFLSRALVSPSIKWCHSGIYYLGLR